MTQRPSGSSPIPRQHREEFPKGATPPDLFEMAGSSLGCVACLRRALQVAARASPVANATALRSTVPLGIQGRRYATSATAEPVDAPRSLQLEPEDATASEKREKAKLQRAVKKHLTYMDDPWKIAQHIEQTLAKDRFDEALLLTQKASKDRQVVVAWNHLIGYQLEKQQLKTAIKLYNEVSRPGPLQLSYTCDPSPR